MTTKQNTEGDDMDRKDELVKIIEEAQTELTELMEPKAVHVATDIQGLTFSIGRDGVWMNISAGSKHVSINMINLAQGSHTKDYAILNWCEQLKEKYTQ